MLITLLSTNTSTSFNPLIGDSVQFTVDSNLSPFLSVYVNVIGNLYGEFEPKSNILSSTLGLKVIL